MTHWNLGGFAELMDGLWVDTGMAPLQGRNSREKDSSQLPNQPGVHASLNNNEDRAGPETERDVSIPLTVTETESKPSELPGALSVLGMKRTPEAHVSTQT